MLSNACIKWLRQTLVIQSKISFVISCNWRSDGKITKRNAEFSSYSIWAISTWIALTECASPEMITCKFHHIYMLDCLHDTVESIVSNTIGDETPLTDRHTQGLSFNIIEYYFLCLKKRLNAYVKSLKNILYNWVCLLCRYGKYLLSFRKL